MSHVRVTHLTEAAPQDCWALMADFANIDFFNPHLAGSRLLDGSPTSGVGTVRQCDMKDGRNYMRERVTDWQEGRRYTVSIYDTTMPMIGAMTTLGLEPRAGGGTELYMDTTYRLRFGLLGRAMDALLMRRKIAGMLSGVLQGLADKAQARA